VVSGPERAGVFQRRGVTWAAERFSAFHHADVVQQQEIPHPIQLLFVPFGPGTVVHEQGPHPASTLGPGCLRRLGGEPLEVVEEHTESPPEEGLAVGRARFTRSDDSHHDKIGERFDPPFSADVSAALLARPRATRRSLRHTHQRDQTKSLPERRPL
jgi:hypothetical protein